MAKQGRADDAERQIALAQMEVEAKDAEPPTGDQYLAIAGVLQQLHEYALADTYLERAKTLERQPLRFRIPWPTVTWQSEKPGGLPQNLPL